MVLVYLIRGWRPFVDGSAGLVLTTTLPHIHGAASVSSCPEKGHVMSFNPSQQAAQQAAQQAQQASMMQAMQAQQAQQRAHQSHMQAHQGFVHGTQAYHQRRRSVVGRLFKFVAVLITIAVAVSLVAAAFADFS